MTQLFYYHELNVDQQVRAQSFSLDVRPEWQCYLVDYRGAVLQGLPLTPVFSTGTVRVPDGTRAHLAALDRAEDEFIVRHAIADWSEMDADERVANHLAVDEGGEIVSRYALGEVAQIYLITRGDRKQTYVTVSTHINRTEKPQ